MARLEIRLLGSFEVTLDGQPVPGFESDKVRALLAYLAVESDRAHRREKLAGLLWPDSTEESARTNLRRVLSNLRTVIRDQEASRPLLDASVQTVRLDRGGDVWVDVTALEQHVADSRCLTAGSRRPPGAVGHLQSAVELYRGPFLEGFSLADSSDFEEWALLEQERLQRLVLEALHCLAEELEEQGDLEQALRHAWRQVELEPWRESGHQQVMRLLARTGQRSAALAQFEICRRSLAKDLGAEPSAETRRLYEAIRDETEGIAPSAVRRAPGPKPEAAPAFSPVTGPLPLERSGPAALPAHPSLHPVRGWMWAAAGGGAMLVLALVLGATVARPWLALGGHARAQPATAESTNGPAAGGWESPQPGGDPGEPPTAASGPVATQTPTLMPSATWTVTPTAVVTVLPATATTVAGSPPPTMSLTLPLVPAPTAGTAALVAPGETVTAGVAGFVPSRIVFAVEPQEGPEQGISYICKMDKDGRYVGALPGHEAGVEERRPLWLPGRAGVVYERVVRGASSKLFYVWQMNSDGSERRPLLGGAEARAPALSSDGKRIAFVAVRDGRHQIVVGDLEGEETVQITSGRGDHRWPSWSPDGKWIAFDGGSGEASAIYVVGVDGKGLEQLAIGRHDSQAAWSPDGNYIAFLSERDGNPEIYVMNADGSAQTNVSNAPTANDMDVTWAPDGRLLFASDRDGDYEIYVMNRNGSHVVQLTHNDVDDRWPNWK